MKYLFINLIIGIIFAILVGLVYKYINFEVSVLMMLVAIYTKLMVGDKE